MGFDKIAAPIQNRNRHDLFILLGPRCTGVDECPRAGARNDFNVSRQLRRGSILGKKNRDQYAERKQVTPNTHVSSPHSFRCAKDLSYGPRRSLRFCKRAVGRNGSRRSWNFPVAFANWIITQASSSRHRFQSTWRAKAAASTS